MPTSTTDDASLYAGLQEVAAGAFPKECRMCGRRYESVHDYITQTQRVGNGSSGLKQSRDDDGHVIVDLFRNCVCGSTLLNSFGDRRDTSEAGLKRRARFAELVERLVAQGLAPDVAHDELLKVLRGEKSAILRVRAQNAR